MKKYDFIVVGGGLAGLSFAILSAKKGYQTLVIEKQNYPRQKVCGEYISNESLGFIKSLGLNLDILGLPNISKFVLTTQYGQKAKTNLKMGGFGISRYLLDELLFKKAEHLGVEFILETKVNAIEENGHGFNVKTSNNETFQCQWAIASYGRISGIEKQKPIAKTFIGVKYHIDKGPASDTIEIHNFEGGYCGISEVENGAFNLCYLAKTSVYKSYGNIKAFEENILSKNPFLKERLKAEKLFEPIFTSQIAFGTNSPSNYLLLGDAAGFIPPITGNGMSLAFRSANELLENLEFANGFPQEVNLLERNKDYITNYLTGRVNKGIFLQKLLFVPNKAFNKTLLWTLINVPGLMKILTQQAVGKTIKP